jgi:hypothetical protein|nr:MAG TPA: hypothetical protein [Herelleviridae sp.]
MKFSTFIKTAAAITALGVVGVIAYSKSKEKKVVALDDSATPEEEQVKTNVNTKVIAYACVGAASILISVPVATEIMYRSTLGSLAKKAIDRGVMSFEDLTIMATEDCLKLEFE